MFPKIDSPCPLKSLALPSSGNFDCSVCKREVHDLSVMTFDQRVNFLKTCEGKVCVSYKMKSSINNIKKTAIAGVFVLSVGIALPVAAQVSDDLQSDMEEDLIIVGGVDNPKTKALEIEANNQKSEMSENQLELIPVVEEPEDGTEQ